MKISQLKIFDDLVVLAKSDLFNDNLGNKKTKPFQSLLLTKTHYVEFVVMPKKRFINMEDKALTKIMGLACSPDCRFLVKSLRKEKYLHLGGFCNQTQANNHREKQIEKLMNQKQQMEIDLKKFDVQSRLTSFGDISRLNDEGLNYIYDICLHSKLLLAYTAGWRDKRIERFNQFFNASCSLLDDALEAYYNHGFLPYGLSREENIKFGILTGVKPYKCPYDTESLRGCSSCPVRCNGQKAISLKEKRTSHA